MNNYASSNLKLLLLLAGLILFYVIFPDFCKMVDINSSLFLNKYLLNSKVSQYFFGILSHRNESWINVIVMLGINLISIFFIKHNNLPHKECRTKSILIILYCWLSFQIVLLINNIVFQKWLQFNRVSPSLIIPNFIRLSQVLNNAEIKDYSHNSFPAGHALILIYWILFINLYANKWIKLISCLLGILLVLPRMVTGAHWLSDTIFSILLGWIYFNLSVWIMMHYEQIKKRIY